MKTIRVGIIGQGRSGFDIHADYLRTDPRFQIVAIADTLAIRRDYAVKNLGCEAVADYRKLLARDDLDLVVNASFSHQHVPITLEALRTGHNVLCEKPLCKKVSEVDSLEAAAKKAGKVLAVYQQSRFAPYFLNVQRVLRSGVLGPIVQISIRFNGHARRWDWQTLRDYNGGNLMNTGPHPVDQALVLFGEGDPKVTCIMNRTKEGSWGDAENHVKLLLSGEGHPTIDLEISSCCAYPFFTYNVYGARGGLQSSATEAEWKYFKPSEAPKQKLLRAPLQKEGGRPAYCSESLTWHTEKWSANDESKLGSTYSAAAAPTQGGMTGRFYDGLYKTLTKGKALDVPLAQVRRQIAVIQEAQRQNPQIYSARKK
ncbi:MAG: Gfo/Idh/MocA family oxidoreductase [Kiritimatiellia bacterium]|nr:Gfo/Idh/MocA family oxidoreductase [Kiritimatiellia bacterium]